MQKQTIAGLLVLFLATTVWAGTRIIPRNNLSLKGNVYNVMDYGATGDGSTDDTTAIQNAIDAAEAAAPSVPCCGTIYFPNPAVNYQVTTITVSAFGMRLLGETALATKIVGTGLTGNVIEMRHNQGRIEQLNIGATAARKAVSATTYSDGTPIAGNHGILFTPDITNITQTRNYVRNVIILGQPDDGLVMEQPEIATIDTVISKENGRFGIHLNGKTLNQGINNIIRNSRTGPTNVNTGIFLRSIFQSTVIGSQVQTSTTANPQVEVRGGQGVRLIDVIIVPGADVAGVGIQIRGEKHSIIGGFINRMDDPIALNTATSTLVQFPYITNDTGSHANQVVSVSSDSHDNVLMLGPLDRYTFVDALVSINASSTGNAVFDTRWRTEDIFTFTDTDATPLVDDTTSTEIFKTANTSGTTITDFDGGQIGQKITVIIDDVNTTLDFTGGPLVGNSGVDWVASSGDMATCTHDGTNWYCDVTPTLSGLDAEVITGTIATTDRGVKVNSDDDLVESQFSPDSGAYATTKTECMMLEGDLLNCKATGGCAIVDIPGTNFDFNVGQYATDADDAGTWTFNVPSNISGTTFIPRLYWVSTHAACDDVDETDDVCWTVGSAGTANDAGWLATDPANAQGVTSRCNTVGDLIITSALDAVTHGWVANERAVVEVIRDVDAGHADCSADAYPQAGLLLAVEVCYEVDNVFSGE